jgi:hypothetical protein
MASRSQNPKSIEAKKTSFQPTPSIVIADTCSWAEFIAPYEVSAMISWENSLVKKSARKSSSTVLIVHLMKASIRCCRQAASDFGIFSFSNEFSDFLQPDLRKGDNHEMLFMVSGLGGVGLSTAFAQSASTTSQSPIQQRAYCEHNAYYPRGYDGVYVDHNETYLIE